MDKAAGPALDLRRQGHWIPLIDGMRFLRVATLSSARPVLAGRRMAFANDTYRGRAAFREP